ncbi:MAG: hypothetical protein EOM54_01365 [Clostridia bacterium]|nr:hypothetical protein [Clostridia bacterium]
MKTLLKIILAVILVLIVAAIGLLAGLTITEYRPEDVEAAEVIKSTEPIGIEETDTESGGTLTIVTWNTGYSGLGADADFVMDGGTGNGKPESEDLYTQNLIGIVSALSDLDADIYLLQEVDLNSNRSYHNDQTVVYRENLAHYTGSTLYETYALNYKCAFVPFPWPPMGKVQSGIQTLSSLPIESAERISLPTPFEWPLRVANLKRCLLVSYIDLPDSDAQLVVVNLHLEAYDDGTGRAAQTKMLYDFIEAEYNKGNYVICGGDFNQSIEDALERWPVPAGYWMPAPMHPESLPEGWTFSCDLETPSCRSLDRPYDSEDETFQYYVIDGFITSPNVEAISVETLDMGFAYTDHNPVQLELRLK